MSNKHMLIGNKTLWTLARVYLRSDLIKDIHSVSDSNLNCEKICINYTNGDTIELTVNDEDASVCATLILQQRETNSDKPIKGKQIYSIPKWTDEFGESQIPAYIARLTYIIKDVQAFYTSGNFAMCTQIINTTLSE